MLFINVSKGMRPPVSIGASQSASAPPAVRAATLPHLYMRPIQMSTGARSADDRVTHMRPSAKSRHATDFALDDLAAHY